MTDPRTALTPQGRGAALERMRSGDYDILVIGGGVTGAGAALDAITRGLRVALVEKRDYAAGTSSRSGKLIHGGLRYLQRLNFPLVRESLRERGLLRRVIAPHLTRPIEFLIPLQHRVWQRAFLGAGLILYDVMGGAGAVPAHRHLSRAQALREAPGLRAKGLIGALAFHDVQIDDARHTLELVRTAAAEGADVASAAEVVGFLRDGERVNGVQLRDLLSGEVVDVRAKHVVSASGVWSDGLQDLLGVHAQFEVQAAKGVHILIPGERLRSDVSLFLQAEDSILVARSWGTHWLIGTTDTPWDEDLDHPAASGSDIDYILRNLNAVLDEPVTVDDIDGVYAGLRPLVKGRPGATSKLSREHAIETVVPGFTTISGGKYTTYRVMAADVIDAALGRAEARSRPSVTRTIELLGARDLDNQRPSILEALRKSGVSTKTSERLLSRYGVLVRELLELTQSRPDLLESIQGAPEYLRAEALYAVLAEGALDLEDVLVRRTHIAIETADRGLGAVEEVADLINDPLGWDTGKRRDRVERYRSRVAAERAAQSQMTDSAAAEAKMIATDFRVQASRSR